MRLVDQKLLKGELAKRHFIDYMAFMWQRSDQFIIGTHTEVVCDAFDQAIIDFKNGKSTFMTIKICVRHGKSDLSARYFPSYFVGQFPDEEVIVAGYAYSLACGFSRDCRSIVSDARYKYVFPGIQVAKKQRSLSNWGIDGHHGQLHWIGIGGSATGKGGAYIGCDDLFKNRLQAESEVYRDRVFESFASDLMTRRAPVSIVAIVGTPWHIDDHYGRIERKQKENPDFPTFKEIKFPAMDKKYEKGILFPERFALDWYVAQKALLGPYASAGLLQCEPIARGGNILNVDKIKEYDEAPEGLIWCRGWDLASTEKERIAEDPDYTVGSLIGVRFLPITKDLVSTEIYLEDVIEGRWAAPKRKNVILATTAKDGDRVQISIEGFGPYKDAYEEMKTILYGVRKVHKSQLPGDKVTKASPIEIVIEAGNFYMKKAPWNDRVKAQMREFSGKSSQHDDIVDSIVVAHDGVNPFNKRVWPQFDNRHIKNLNIDWNKTIIDKYSSLHYAGMYQKEDLSVWVVLAIWDAYKGYLFIYDAFMCGDPIPSVVCEKIINRMMLKKLSCEAIVTNSLMWSEKGYHKNIALQYRKYFQEHKIVARIKKAINYDDYSSIVEIGQLFDKNKIYVDNRVNSFILQVMSWCTVDMGKQAGSRPDEDDDGYCRALCLIDSELRKHTRWQEVMKPVFMDYSKMASVRSVYNNAEKIAINKKITEEEFITGSI